MRRDRDGNQPDKQGVHCLKKEGRSLTFSTRTVNYDRLTTEPIETKVPFQITAAMATSPF